MSEKPTLKLAPSVLRLNAQTGADGVSLDVANPHPTSSVLYKCKTTSPQRYIVRNRQGVIAPGGTSKVHISLQRGTVLTGSEESDIFLVEARYLQPGESEKATAPNTDIGEMMKVLGKGAIAKQQVSCELSVGGDAAVSSKKPVDAQSTCTQPTAVSHKRDPLRRDAAATAAAADGAATADGGAAQPAAAAGAGAAPAAQRPQHSEAASPDPLRQSQPASAPAADTSAAATQQQVRQRQVPNAADPGAAASRATAASPRGEDGSATAAKKKTNPLVLIGAVVTIALAGAYALGVGSTSEQKAVVPAEANSQ